MRTEFALSSEKSESAGARSFHLAKHSVPDRDVTSVIPASFRPFHNYCDASFARETFAIIDRILSAELKTRPTASIMRTIHTYTRHNSS